jgi:hypothetical protein
MDSLITAAARALAAGDLLGALKRIALRDNTPGAGAPRHRDGACALAILKTRRFHWRLAGVSRKQAGLALRCLYRRAVTAPNRSNRKR